MIEVVVGRGLVSVHEMHALPGVFVAEKFILWTELQVMRELLPLEKLLDFVQSWYKNRNNDKDQRVVMEGLTRQTGQESVHSRQIL